MGRKPNKLILEFFERGAKLEDSSNRYQHTCRSCGEKFPKGRIDSLIAHLLKKCPAIPVAERQRALTQLSETPNQHGSFNQLAVSLRQEQQSSGEIPFQPGNDLSPLETLAEVSRQQLDTNGQYIPAGEAGTGKKRKRSAGRQAMAQQHHFNANDVWMSDDPLPSANDTRGVNQANNVTDPTDPTDSRLIQGVEQYLTSERPRFDLSTGAPTARMIPDQLAMTASAANDMLPNAGFPLDPKLGGAQGDSSMIDPALQDDPSTQIDAQPGPKAEGDHEQIHNPSQDQLKLLVEGPDNIGVPLNTPNRAVHGTGAMPQAHFMSDFSITGDDPKPKVRSRFSASRRKEVQEVRKQGACVRCRMLKKPCSGGTPCNTCSAVETARLWKSSCIRARLADEFDLYAAGLFTVVAFHDVNIVKSHLEFQKSMSQIKATHFPGIHGDTIVSARSVSATFETETVIPFDVTQMWNQVESQFSHRTVEIIDQEADEVGTSLDNYIQGIGSHFFERETSTFMRPTLLLAQEICISKLDPVLKASLDLWTANQILVDSDLQWHIHNTHLAGFSQNDASPERSEMLINSNPFSYRLMSQQLLSQIEKKSANLAKRLLNDLERRLLQRQQNSPQHFETFLAAIILLNCIERMTWLFSTWAAKLEHPMDGHMTSQASSTWPLEKDPVGYIGKGEKIAGVVAMMVRVRGVPPPIAVEDISGLLRLGSRPSPKQNQIKSLDASETANSPAGERDPVVATWFENINLNAADLKQLQDNLNWDQTNCRCWDLRFISRLLLQPPAPERQELRQSRKES